jgi:hypothetical protein
MSTPYRDTRTLVGPCDAKACVFFKERQKGEYVYSLKAHFLLVGTCSANTSTQYSFLNSRMNRGSHNSLATPRSLQQRISALLLQASVAVGIPEGSKYSCSPRAIPTSLAKKKGLSLISQKYGFTYRPRQTRAYSRLTIFGPTFVSLRGAKPQPPGPKALFKILRYLISGR